MSLGYIFYLLLVLTVLSYGILNRQRLSRPYLWLVGLIGVSLSAEAMSRILAYFQTNSFPTYHLLIPILIGILGKLYYDLFTHPSIRWVFVRYSLVLALSSICISIGFQPIDTFPSLGMMLLGIAIIPQSLVLFLELLQRPVDVPLLKQSVFWFNTGNLIFYALTFFIFSYFRLLPKVPEWSYTLVWTTNLILYSCYGLSLYHQVTNNDHGNKLGK